MDVTVSNSSKDTMTPKKDVDWEMDENVLLPAIDGNKSRSEK